MILFKKSAKDKVKSYIFCANQFLSQICHKKIKPRCKQKQSRLINLCNILDFLTSTAKKIAW